MAIRLATLVGVALLPLESAFAMPTSESVNAGSLPVSGSRPFVTTGVAEFDEPWAIAFLPTGKMLVTERGGRSLVRVSVDPDGGAHQLDRWDMGARIRDVAVAPDGAVWLIEDGADGRLLRLSKPR